MLFLGFGEIMARIAPEGCRRWRQALPGRVEMTWGGGEANVCASLAMFGNPVRYATALPRHAVSESLVATLRGLGVEVDQILWRERGRLGLYYLETGANQRGSTVVYDRGDSAISLAEPSEYDFDALLQGVAWLHVTGITPSISEAACRTNLELVRRAKQHGAKVSCDLNFRKKLWNWRPGTDRRALARECLSAVLQHTDVVIANEEDAADVLGIHAQGTDVERGRIDAAGYEQVAADIASQFPGLSHVAITLRESLSASHNNWGGLLLDVAANRACLAPLDDRGAYRPYEIRNIIDRVGAGDSFAAGLLHALNSPQYGQPEQAIGFAVAASCLKHSIHGDFNYATAAEVAALAGGNATGRVQR